MNIFKIMMIFMLMVFSHYALAYGSSSSKKACKKPTFTQFTPPHLSKVAPQSGFSFQTSSLTRPESIKVIVKKLTVDVSIDKNNNSYIVTATLPDSLQETYARISIQATGTNQCKGSDGWLLNITTQ